MRALPAVLPDVDVTAARRYLGDPRVAVLARVVGPGDALAGRVVAPADAAGVQRRGRVQGVIAAGGLAVAVDAQVEGVGAAGRTVDDLVAQHVVLVAGHLAVELAAVLWYYCPGRRFGRLGIFLREFVCV